MWSESPGSGSSTSQLYSEGDRRGGKVSTPVREQQFSFGRSNNTQKRSFQFHKDDSLSFSRSPAHLLSPSFPSTSTQAPVIDQVQLWFNSIISHRSKLAAGVGAVMSSVVFSVVYLLLQLSLYSPIQSFYDSISSVFSVAFWFLFVVHGSLFLIFSLFFCYPIIFKVDQVKRVSYVSPLVWSVVALLGLHFILSTLLLLFFTRSPYFGNGFPLFYLSLSLISSTFFCIFENDFQLTFSCHPKPKMLNFLLSLVLDGELATLVVYTCLRCMGSALAFGVLLGTPLYGIRAVVSLLFPSLLLTVFSLCFLQIVSVKFLISIVKHIVMEPISFSLPPSYQIHSPTAEQIRTINRVIEAGDPLLKYFAFFDLRRIAWSDSVRRKDVFSLSQPGGHARNWACMRSACLFVMKQVQINLDQQSNRLFGGSLAMDSSIGSGSVELTEEGDSLKGGMDREMLLMPNRAKRQVYTSPVYNRHRKAILEAPKRARPQTIWPKCVAKLGKALSDEVYVVRPYDANVVILAIESLYMFVVYSYDEDNYGVVQKSLEEIIGQLLGLIHSIDTYFRSRAAAAYSEATDSTVRNIDVVLFAAMNKIQTKFGPQLFKSLNLSPEQFQKIRSMCLNA